MREKLTKRFLEGLTSKDKPFEVRDTEIAGLLVRVQPSGVRAWYYDYRHRGVRNRRLLGRYPGLSAEGARSLCPKLAAKVADGVDLQHEKRRERQEATRARQATLKVFLDGQYEPWANANLKSARFQLARVRSDFASWMEKPMTDFSPFAIEGIRQRWRKAGKQSRSINRDIQRLQSVLSKALQWGILERHPLAGLKPLKTDKTGRVRFLTANEEKRLLTALETREESLRLARSRFNTWRMARGKEPLPEREGDLLDHLRPLVLLALNTGLRRGELLGLTWGAISIDAKLLTVTAVTAKSGHTRRIPLNSAALEVLKAWFARQGRPAADKLVFPGADGQRMKRIDSSWASLIRSAGLTNFRLHDCRHHFASKLVQVGVDLYIVKALLGHSEIAMTERYAHLAPDNLRAAVEKLAG